MQVAPLEMGLHASYWHKLNANQSIGVEIEGKGAAGECATTLGYAFDIPGANCVVKGMCYSLLKYVILVGYDVRVIYADDCLIWLFK